MEEVIQVLIFIAITISIVIGKYKEVNTNRPGQRTRRPEREKRSIFLDEDENQNVERNQVPPFQSLFDLEEFEEGFGGEFSKRNQKGQEEPETFSPSSSWEDLFNPVSKGLKQRQSLAPPFHQTPEEKAQFRRETILSENAEDIEEMVFTGEDTYSQSTVYSQPNNDSSKVTFGTSRQQDIADKSQRTASESAITSPKNFVKKKSKVHLRTKQEARQAFIYSEIFNRKYE